MEINSNIANPTTTSAEEYSQEAGSSFSGSDLSEYASSSTASSGGSYARAAGSSFSGQSVAEIDTYGERMKTQRPEKNTEKDNRLAADIQVNLGLPEHPLVLIVLDKVKARNGHLLVIVGPRNDVDKVVFGAYRFIIDIDTGAIICRFMPDAANMISDTIQPDENGQFAFKHKFGPLGEKKENSVSWPVNQIQFYREQTGPQIVLLRYAGEDFFVSPKSFSSKLPGSGRLIADIYRSL